MSASLFKYRDAFYRSQKFLDYLKIESFPIDLFQIFLKAKRHPIFVTSLNEYNQNHIPLKIKDAKCFYKPGKAYFIVYNDQKPTVRIRFSLAHELGHIILGHLNDERTELERGGLDDVTYYILEGEANTFAGNFLAPPILIYERAKEQSGNITASTISQLFKISVLAAERRLVDFSEWNKFRVSSHELNIRKKYGIYTHPRYCNKCNSQFFGDKVTHCPICGNHRLSKFQGDTVMKYEKIELNDYGKAITCPICGNEEILEEGDYCHICGSVLINRCDMINMNEPVGYCQGHKPLPGNARYCPYCGGKTTFFRMKALKTWEDEVQTEIEEFEGIPDVSTENELLPF